MPPGGQRKRKKPAVPIDALADAIRGIVREELQRVRPSEGASLQERHHEEVQVEEAATTRRYGRPGTIRRSEAVQKEMERIPSGFERHELPQSSRKLPYRGLKEYPRYFRVLASQSQSTEGISTAENECLEAFSTLPSLRLNTIKNEGHEERQPKRQRQAGSARHGRLLPYEQCIDLTWR
ncbi:hypothetical protein NM208_g8594 [Fusarium decemcellulare]|uniref:Uncharacterized protein n=1 Tax=Fusarium decemcellulare TaxID=57161 RepID=A0ACC1S4P4_9HYPO|nr:hypothetical protein NM208_g8594 [Fusarium decemcellulare]